jgi:hypothetical protein
MPKVEIDYSNTIFYKIFCKDPAIKDLYVGLTTNFVQRKHAHKQSCKNKKALNHNCKLYSAIRKAGGWDNWQMEIIAFHNCANSYEARKKEQGYFEALGATLNSIDPFPKPKIKEPPVKIVKEKKILFCEPCNVHFSHWTIKETHNHTKKHNKMVATFSPNNMAADGNQIKQKNSKTYCCKLCDYTCCKKFNWDRHVLTPKHARMAKGGQKGAINEPGRVECKYSCESCNKIYASRNGLWKHQQKCNISKKHSESIVTNYTTTEKDELINYLMKETQEFKKFILEIINKDTHIIT